MTFSPLSSLWYLKLPIDQGGVGGGVTMVPNAQGGFPVSKKVQNSQHFLSKIVLYRYSLQEYQKLTNLNSSDFL